MHNIFIKRVLLRQIEWRSVTSSSRYLANPIKMVGTRLLVLAVVAVWFESNSEAERVVGNKEF